MKLMRGPAIFTFGGKVRSNMRDGACARFVIPAASAPFDIQGEDAG